MINIFAHNIAANSSEPNPLKALRDAVIFSSLDWGEARDTAWIYGIVAGWDVYPDDADEESAMAFLAAKYNWSEEQVAHLRELHKIFSTLEENYEHREG